MQSSTYKYKLSSNIADLKQSERMESTKDILSLRGKLPIVINKVLREYESNHSFEGLSQIRKQIEREFQKSGGKYKQDKKSNLMKTLSNHLFNLESDYTNPSYILDITGVSNEDVKFWIKNRNLDPNIIMHHGNGTSSLSIPHLHKQNALNIIPMKEMKEGIGELMAGENNISKFNDELYRYVKCLSKRKADFVAKIIGGNQGARKQRFVQPTTFDLQTNEDKSLTQKETELGEFNKESASISIIPIIQEMMEKYEQTHFFQNWVEIKERVEKYCSSEVTKKQLMSVLNNEFFIETSDAMVTKNTICYVAEDNMELEPKWYSFAEIFENKLKIIMPNLFTQTKETKTKFKQWLSYNIANCGLKPIDSTDTTEKMLENLLNSYLKRLSKRKNDFINAMFRLQPKQHECDLNQQIPTIGHQGYPNEFFQPLQPIYFIISKLTYVL